MSEFNVKPEQLKQIAEDIKKVEKDIMNYSGNINNLSKRLLNHSTSLSQASRALTQTAERIEDNSISFRQLASVLSSIASVYIQTETRLAGNSDIPEKIKEAVSKARETIQNLIRDGIRIAGGTSSLNSSYDGDPVDMTNGNYVDDVEELKIYGPSDLKFIRHYNSRYLNTGTMGIGWSHNYEISLLKDEDLLIVIWGDQTKEGFVKETDSLYKSIDGGTDYLTVTESEIDLHTTGKTTYRFDHNGHLTEIRYLSVIRNLSFTYDENKLSRVEDHYGNFLTYTYNEDGLLESAADHTGRKVSFEYDKSMLARAVASDNLSIEYRYDEAGHLNETVGPDGIVRLHNEYDAANRVTYQKMADGSEAFYAYNGEEVLFTDRNGAQTIYVHDDKGRILENRYPKGTERFGYDECGRRISYLDLNGNVYIRKYDEKGNISEYVDAAGNISRYAYDDNGNTIMTEVPDCGTTFAEYDEQGNLISLVDSMNIKTLFTYKDGLLAQAKYADGNQVSFAYDEKGRMVQATDERGFTQRFEYDDLGRRTLFEDGCHAKTTYTYDAADRIKTIRNELGQDKTYHYENGRLVSVKDFDGFSESWTYDSMGQISTHTDKAGRITGYSYDSMGNVSEIHFPDGGVVTRRYDDMNRLVEVKGPEKSTLRMEYDGDGNCICRDEDGFIHEYVYDSMNHVSEIKENGHLRKFTYDKAGRIKCVEREDGEIFEYQHLPNGKVVSARKPGNLVYKYEYDVRGRLVYTSNGISDITGYEYYSNGQISKVLYQNGTFLQNEYDPEGRLISETRSDGYGLRYEYDALGRRLSTTDTDGRKKSWNYDADGNPTEITDSLGRKTEYRYSPVGNLLFVKDPLGNVIRYDYDPMNRLIAVLQANVSDEKAAEIFEKPESYQNPENKDIHLTTWKRNRDGQITARTDALGNVKKWQYYDDGQVYKIWDEENRCTEYRYDEAKRLSSVIYPDEKKTEYTYNAMGWMTGVTDRTGCTSFEYDAYGRMTASTDPNNQKFVYELDAAGRRKGLVYPDGTKLSFGYNEKGQLANIDDAGFAAGYHYDDFGRVSSKIIEWAKNDAEHRHSLTEKYTYLPSGKLSGMTQTKDSELISEYAYRYDEIGNMISRQEVFWDNGNKSETDIAYEYDPMNRLTKVSVKDQEGKLSTAESYEYDDYGNRIIGYRNGITTKSMYNAEGQLTECCSSGGDTQGTTSYFYDKTGRLIRTKGNHRSERKYDTAGHLTEIREGDDLLRLNVNSLGHIISEEDKEGSVKKFWVDYSLDALPIMGINDGGGWTGYIRDSKILGSFNGKNSNAFVCDEKGSVNRIFDMDGLPSCGGGRIRYDSFGNVETGAAFAESGSPFGYTGLYKPLTGDTWRTGSREYDPGIGRFMARDDDRYVKIKRPETLNLYQYCFANPIIWIDPAGTDCYIFYKADSADCSFNQQKQLAKQYGYDISHVHMIPFSDKAAFMEDWNSMGTVNGEKVDIDTVIIESHANPYVISDNENFTMTTADIQNLQNKDMDNLILEGCNTGHMDYVEENVATAFAHKTNGAPVLAADGTVYYGKSIFPWSKAWYDPKDDKHFKSYRPEGSNRKADGWVVYQADENGEITTHKVGKKKMNIKKMLTELRKYPKTKSSCSG